MRDSRSSPAVRLSGLLGALLFSIALLGASAPETRSTAAAAHVDLFATPGFVFEEDCVIQVAAFLARFAKEHPTEKARLVRVTVPGGKEHAIAAFTEVGRVRFWDQSIGVLPGSDDVAGFESRACARVAQTRFDVVVRRIIERGGFPAPRFAAPTATSKQLSYLEQIRDSLPKELHAEMFATSDAAGRVRYVLGFRAGSLWGVYAAGTGSVLTDLERMGAENEEPVERKLTFVTRVAAKLFHENILVARLHSPETKILSSETSFAPA